MSDLRIGGLDLSLTSTGIAVIDHGCMRTAALQTGKLRGWERVELIITECLKALDCCDVIAAEGLAYGAKGNALLDLAALRGIVTLELHRQELPVVDVSPASLKKYATGSHMADKLAMYGAALTRLGALRSVNAITTGDEADAAWLAHMAADWYGCSLVKMPEAQRAAMSARHKSGKRKGAPVIDWPQLAASPAQAGQLALG